MAKIEPLSRADASAEQRRVGDPIFEVRGPDYGGPFAVLLHTPLGAACLAGAVLLQVAGLAWAARLTRLEVST